ncbi:hypothetical protein GTP55_13165 [Duganella sp. FT109W]|uniref:Uncharacterized protein n=1 Tax=Duganella margarita TaxID=2692170 RepID=A0ABW9WHH8_9BURK|nr:hypothetical protein [Duganella margarita]MYN40326.1 hypothetical protein [Duganella margarita]
MPELNVNIEGLRSQSQLLGIFVVEQDVSPEKRKWRTWLVHCLVKAGRHYSEARTLIQQQLVEAQRPATELAQGRQLHIFDFALAMEDCITALEKAVVCLHALSRSEPIQARVLALPQRPRLNEFRRQQEHMHQQLASGQTGDGPIIVGVTADGSGMALRALKMSFKDLHEIITTLYLDLCVFFPHHEVNSPRKPQGVARLTMSASLTITPGAPPTSTNDET